MKKYILIAVIFTVASCKRCYEVRTSLKTNNSTPVVTIQTQCGLTQKQAEQLRQSLTYTAQSGNTTIEQRAWVTPQ
jgi:hypothetical protein